MSTTKPSHPVIMQFRKTTLAFIAGIFGMMYSGWIVDMTFNIPPIQKWLEGLGDGVATAMLYSSLALSLSLALYAAGLIVLIAGWYRYYHLPQRNNLLISALVAVVAYALISLAMLASQANSVSSPWHVAADIAAISSAGLSYAVAWWAGSQFPVKTKRK